MSMSIRGMDKKGVGFSPDIVYDQQQPAVFRKHYSKVSGKRIRATSPKTTSSFMKRVGAKIAKALRFVSCRNKCSCKVSNSAASFSSLPRSRSYAEALDDSQRAEAIEDCIEFLNSSSSSFPRSNSVASSNCY